MRKEGMFRGGAVKAFAPVAMVSVLACALSFAVTSDEESSITFKSSFVNPYVYSEDKADNAGDAAYKRDATGQKVPAETDLSGDTKPASEPL